MPSPTTPLLDTFTRANEDPIAGLWLGPVFAGDSGLKVLSNAAAGRAGAGSESYWKIPFPAAQEAFFTLTSKYTGVDSGVTLFLNLQTPGVAGMDCYACAIYKHSGSGNDFAEIYRFDNGTPTVLATSGVLTVAAGHRFWFQNAAGVLTVYQSIAGGVWTSILTTADATYGAGFVGLGCDDGTFAVNAFGGGALGSASRMLEVF